ncbi:DM13 domain-containing protein [Roseibacillus ishigakijimensis]|uniref:DM13 domain-containing protein n=1 Tax=Roseibacillus ishigakijimensis TaxID=454146 RepID=A0A934VMH3_9BACT|nr:DM13 domain-containing protein [Roseibacillus ishigakijimensis]MBK1834091.1 DM13 domain-containing protein [Roseibacillus ishigakijimensis]
MKKPLLALPQSLIVTLLVLFFGAITAAAQSGTWIKKANSISGTWSIGLQGGQRVIALKDFKTATAPDLKIFLSTKPADQLTSRNATNGALYVAKLKSSIGDQSYVLPKDVDLSRYKTVLIHCEKYSKLWGVGKL